jgi:poly(hydroxyalkanoate) depolymerase family esterase
MVRLLRRWLRKVGIRQPFFRRSYELDRGRFLGAKFKDSPASGPFRRSSRLELKYRLYLPSGSSRRATLPLIVMLHGCKQDPLSFAEGTRMNTVAEEHRCAVLYPEQNRRSNPLRCWNWFASTSLEGQGEAALIARLIDRVTNRRPIDPRRVYVVGMSAGGAMACILAMRHSRLFAACAIHSGVMYGAASSPMQALAAMRSGSSVASIDEARRLVIAAGESAVTVPTLVIHGDRDTTVNPLNADQIIEQMKARAKFVDPTAGALVASGERCIDSGDRTYRQQDYTRRGQIVLRKVLVEGLGHAWSGGDSRHEFNDAAGPDASRLILDFVIQYQREARSIVACAPRDGELA